MPILFFYHLLQMRLPPHNSMSGLNNWPSLFFLYNISLHLLFGSILKSDNISELFSSIFIIKLMRFMQFIEHSTMLALFDYGMTTKPENIDHRYSRKLRSRTFSQYQVTRPSQRLSAIFFETAFVIFSFFFRQIKSFPEVKNKHFLS